MKSEVYHAPLKLEDGTPGTFRETTFEDDGKGPVRFWLKNDNKEGEEPKVCASPPLALTLVLI